MHADLIQKNALRARALLDQAARHGPVEICAVTKTQDAQAVNAVWDSGISRIGENRVQELMQKFPALNPHFQVDLIGQLQTNKVKYIVNCVSRVQSLDRMALALELDRRAREAGRVIPCLVQVNVASEAQKAGVSELELPAFLQRASALRGIAIEGLMAIMPLTDDPNALRPYFRRMRTWFDRLRNEAPPGVRMDCLSMGMSGDYVIAAEEGATLVRLGSALFGAREVL